MRILLLLIGAAVAAGVGGGLFVYFGVYNISATQQHTWPVYWLVEKAMLRSVKVRSDDIKTPDLQEQALLYEGFRLYASSCQPCHGGPGVPPEPFALGMTPLPANLVGTAREWKPEAIYWTVKHGIKMTGMPAWKYRMSEHELWATVAFVEQLPKLLPVRYQAMLQQLQAGSQGALQTAEATVLTDSNPRELARVGSDAMKASAKRGREVVSQYGCGTCHVIPGITGANRMVGPPLTGIGSRKYIAGVLHNSFDNMVLWLKAPQEVDPLSAMPNLYVNEEDARDMAAYLMTLKDVD